MLRDQLKLDYVTLSHESVSIPDSTWRRTVRVALVCDAAPQLLTPLFKALFARQGIGAEMYEAAIGTAELELFDDHSGLHAFTPDTVVIANATFALRDRYYAFAGDPGRFVEDEMDRARSLWSAVADRGGASIVQMNYVIPHERLFGNYDARMARSLSWVAAALNDQLAQAAGARHDVFMCDIDYVAAYHGRKTCLDEKMWLLAKAFCALEHLPHIVQSAIDIIRSLNGDGVKCVVLDLDNTLWGGIVGDDGVDGIRLGHLEDGDAYVQFQRFLLALKQRGILLAVCSKNELDTARLPFRHHPDMVLREEDIAVFVADWSSKADGVRRIRDVLDISLSSMVFVDDNPFERGVVRDALPEVIVPELPDDPVDYVRCLTELNLFETTHYSELDASRTDLYRVEAQRKVAERSFASADEYLASLEMQITCMRFDSFHLPRIAQLLQRSNQFNVRTRRFSEAQCQRFMDDTDNWLPLFFSLRDKYGDNGLISVIVARLGTRTLAVEEWVMSCRVLARGVEQFALNVLVTEARSRSIELVTARYEPTAKNRLVKDLFDRLGFRRVNETPDGASDWELDTASYQPRLTHIALETTEALHAAG